MADEDEPKTETPKPDGKGVEALVPVAKEGVGVAREGVQAIRDGVSQILRFANDVLARADGLAGLYVEFKKTQADQLPPWQRALPLLEAEDRGDALAHLVELEHARMQHELDLAHIANDAEAARSGTRFRFWGGLLTLSAGGVAVAAGGFGVVASGWLVFAGLTVVGAGLTLISPKLGGRVLDSLRALLPEKKPDGTQQLPPDRSDRGTGPDSG